MGVFSQVLKPGKKIARPEGNPMGKLGNEIRPNNGVIITYYVESSASHVQGMVNRTRKIKQNQRRENPPAARSCGYDRRAQLLAHAHELRKSHLPTSSSFISHLSPVNIMAAEKCLLQNHKRPENPETQAKHRRRACTPCRSQNNSQRRWRYERVKKEVNTEKVDQPCCPKCFTGRIKDAIGVGKSNSSLFKKIRIAVKEVAGRCKGKEEVAEQNASPLAHRSSPWKHD